MVEEYIEKIRPIIAEMFSKESSGHDISDIHHFYNKLLRLGKYMNTNTAKEIAEKRTNFMNDFVQTFLKEWKAEV